MADKKVKIQIDTTANTKGAKDASKALDKVVQSEKEVAKSASQAQANTDALERELTAVSDKARVSEFAFYDLDASIAKTGNTSQAVANGGIKAVGNGFKNVGSTIGQVGFQVQDFAVQVGGGTSALTAFAQQGSQLLGIFGPGGAVAGALLAIGAIGVRVFSEMGKEAEEFAFDVETTAKNAAANIRDVFDEAIAGIESSTQQAEIIAGQYDGIRQAADQYAQSELSNSDKRQQALAIINDLLGRQRDLIAELQAQQQAESDQRSLTEQQQIAAQQQRITDAKTVSSAKEQELEGLDQTLSRLRLELVERAKKVELIRQEKQELEAAKKAGDIGAIGLLAAATDSDLLGQVLESRSRGQAAGERLDSKSFQSDIATSEASFDEVNAQIEEIRRRITETQNASGAALQDIETVSGEVAIQIARIQEVSRNDELLAAATNARDTIQLGQDQAITGLNEILAQAQPSNEFQKQARDQIAQAVSDGRITAQESSLIAGQLSILMGAMDATNQQSLTQVTRMINSLGVLSQRQTENERRLQDVERRLGKMPTN